MIEVMSKSDIVKVDVLPVQTYLHKRFKELKHPLEPSTEGYFVYVGDFTSLQGSHRLRYVTLPAISEGLFRNIEAVSIKDDIVEVSLLFNNEFLLSLIFYSLDINSLNLITNQSRQKKFSLPKGTPFSICSDELSHLAMSLGIVLIRCMIKK